MTRLERFGWRGEAVPGVARIVSAHGDYYHLVCNEAEGEIIARKKKSAFSKRIETVTEKRGIKKVERGEIGREILKPITGDFVKFRYNPQGESMITEILPRFSHFERKDPTAKRKSQTLAVNFDTLFVMMSLNEDFSTARIDRYLTLAEDMGEAEAVVAGDDGLVRLVELLRLLLVRDELLEATLLADRVVPACGHRSLRLGVLEKLKDALVAGLERGKLVIDVTRLVETFGERVVRGDSLKKRRIVVAALVRSLDGDRSSLGLARSLSRLHRTLDIVRIKRILHEKLLLLYKYEYLLHGNFHHLQPFHSLLHGKMGRKL